MGMVGEAGRGPIRLSLRLYVLGAREARYSDAEIFGYLSNNALQVVGVPFVVLTLGAAMYWALRGFGRSN